MKTYLEAIVNFNQKAKPLIDSMGEYDKQLEQNKEIEQQLAEWQKRFDQSGKCENSNVVLKSEKLGPFFHIQLIFISRTVIGFQKRTSLWD